MKNLGVGVSGYLDPEGRSFETVVYQVDKPVLDKELNLTQDIASSLTRRANPSGWVGLDPLSKTSTTSSLFLANSTANLLSVAQPLKALVNGWLVQVENTNSSIRNQVSLGAGPTGNGSRRTDLVILEVFRRRISPSTTDGKSVGGRIWRHGNVKVASGDDAVLNFVDDLQDVTFGAETTQRVQVQYRLRVVPGVDLLAYPVGISDPIVVANSVPASAGAPDGVATAFTFSSQSSAGDPGLWRAGDGNPANTLGTVDGYMYAIPLCAVFRRNTTAFSRNLNRNGGVASPGPSDRPDGLFHDIIVEKDIADLRQFTTLSGWNYEEIAQKNLGLLLDNALKTEWELTTQGGGALGHTYMWGDEIGVLPGDGVQTGDTPAAEFIGQFDSTRRFFSDRPTYEVLTFQISPGDPNISTPNWQSGTVVTLNPAQLAQYPFGAGISFITRAPSGTRILDVVRARIQGTTGGEVAYDLGQVNETASLTPDAIPIESIQGLGEYPPSNVIITLGTVPGGMTTERLFVDLLVAYPSGQGLTKTPVGDYGAATFVVNNPAALTVAAPVSYGSLNAQTIDYVHREVKLQYQTSTLTFTTTAETSSTAAFVTLPERALSVSAVRVNGVGYVGGFSLSTSGRVVTLLGAPTSIGDVVAVDYVALRPMPQSGVQMTVYYDARAAQTVQSNSLGTTQTLTPRWISPHLYTLTCGSGSQGEAFPYPYAYVQTGGALKAVGMWSGEHELDGDAKVYVSEFNASSGFLKVPAFVPYVPASDQVTFNRVSGDVDIENRTYFPNFAAGYVPSAFGQPLADERVHKVFLPALMEAESDSSLGKKGSLYLVLFVRWANFDAENSIKFLTSNNTTVASVFRVSGHLLNGRG